MDNDIKAIAEQTAGLIVAVQNKTDAIEKRLGEGQAANSAEMKSFMEKITAEAKRLDELEKVVARKAVTSANGEVSEQKQAFMAYMRKGEAGLTPEQFKTMTVADSTDAGYLAVPNEVLREITKNITEFSPIRSVARVITAGATVEVPKRTAATTAAWVAEVGTRTEETTYKVGRDIIPNHEMNVYFKASSQMLEDSAFNLEAEMNSEVAEAAALKEGTAFVSGTGILQPEGFLGNATVLAAYVFQGETSTVTTGVGIKKCYFGLKTTYANNASWCMSRATMASVAALVGGDGQYLLGYLGDTPGWTLMGRPVLNCVDMPAIGAGTYPIAFGDFKSGYMIVDRLGMTVIRDPYTSKSTGIVEFMFRRRVGAAVIKPEAIQVLKIATS
jgi:HK97 family phage major capsid protein